MFWSIFLLVIIKEEKNWLIRCQRDPVYSDQVQLNPIFLVDYHDLGKILLVFSSSISAFCVPETDNMSNDTLKQTTDLL